MPVRITEPDDPRIAPYRNIRERDLAGHGGRFIAEGEVVLRVLLTASRLRACSVLVAENRLAPLAPLLERAEADGVPVFTAAPQVMDAIAGFHIHRGVLALGERPGPVTPRDLLKDIAGRSLVVVTVGVSNHDNMGGIFRNAAAFGADAVLLDAASCDPLYRKAIRVSVGASLIVPFSRGHAAEVILTALGEAGFTCLALSPGGEHDVRALPRPERAALLLGAEGPGLPDEIMARAMTVRIGMAGGFDSLNVATSSGIALHHMSGL